MKKISTLFAAFAFMAVPASAQWQPSDTGYKIVAQDSLYGQGGLKTVHTADGKTVLTWHKHSVGLKSTDPASGYHLYMQTYDAAGNALCGKDGKEISAHRTRSWVTDYSTKVSDDGKIYISYSDARNDSLKENVENFIYCYTPEGTSLWSTDGVKINGVTKNPQSVVEDVQPLLCLSGSNIYSMLAHTETYNVKADSTNWTPSPWFPNQEMPDSVSVSDYSYQIMRYNADGTEAWAAPLVVDYESAWFYPATNGNFYLIYVNSGSGFSARLIDADGKDVWENPVVVEKECISGGMYTTEPTVVSDGNGGLYMAYRTLLSWTGYCAVNRLTPDGKVYSEGFLPNGTQDGNTDSSAEVAVNGDKTFVAWGYIDTTSAHTLWVNQLDINGDYTWEGDSLLGYAYDQNEMWGCTAVKIIPQADGWVLLYANSQSYSAANFYACKIGTDGKTMWKRQLAQDGFKLNSYTVDYDDKYAYFFYTCSQDKDENYKELPGPGGLRVMCIDITGSDVTGINKSNTVSNGTSKEIYNAQGMRVADMNTSGLYIIKENGKTHKVFSK